MELSDIVTKCWHACHHYGHRSVVHRAVVLHHRIVPGAKAMLIAGCCSAAITSGVALYLHPGSNAVPHTQVEYGAPGYDLYPGDMGSDDADFTYDLPQDEITQAAISGVAGACCVDFAGSPGSPALIPQAATVAKVSEPISEPWFAWILWIPAIAWMRRA
jgi:hypothetical protein